MKVMKHTVFKYVLVRLLRRALRDRNQLQKQIIVDIIDDALEDIITHYVLDDPDREEVDYNVEKEGQEEMADRR